MSTILENQNTGEGMPYADTMTTLKHIKRVVIAVVGGTVLAIGLALVVLPGPTFLVIPAGLTILAVEFAWARRWLRKAREWLPGKCAPRPPRSGVLPGLYSVRAEKP